MLAETVKGGTRVVSFVKKLPLLAVASFKVFPDESLTITVAALTAVPPEALPYTVPDTGMFDAPLPS